MWFRNLSLTLLLIAGWAIAGYYFADYTLESPKREEPVEFEIKENTTLSEIGTILAENQLIRYPWLFSGYLWWQGKTNLKAGVYQVTPEENFHQIINKIAAGEQDLVKVTIPEGKTVLEIADVLESKGFDKEAFLEEVNRKEAEFEFEKEIPHDPQRIFHLEGYLFPSTYLFRKQATSKQIVNQMLEQFEKKMKDLKADAKLKEQNLTLHEWVTFASVIEKEGRVRKELPRIAGVIRNRLQKKMELEVDATVIYAWALEGETKNRLFYKDLEIQSPFNTYKNPGLPPGPISSPSLNALEAVLQPEPHQYLYYVTKKNGTFEHYFSETFAQHQKYIQQSEKNQQNQ